MEKSMQQYPTDRPQPAPTAEEMARWQQQRQQSSWPGYQSPPPAQPAVQVNVQTGASRKRPPIGWIAALVVVLVIGYAVGSSSHSGGSATTTDTPQAPARRTATHPPVTP